MFTKIAFYSSLRQKNNLARQYGKIGILIVDEYFSSHTVNTTDDFFTR